MCFHRSLISSSLPYLHRPSTLALITSKRSLHSCTVSVWPSTSTRLTFATCTTTKFATSTIASPTQTRGWPKMPKSGPAVSPLSTSTLSSHFSTWSCSQRNLVNSSVGRDQPWPSLGTHSLATSSGSSLQPSVVWQHRSKGLKVNIVPCTVTYSRTPKRLPSTMDTTGSAAISMVDSTSCTRTLASSWRSASWWAFMTACL